MLQGTEGGFVDVDAVAGRQRIGLAETDRADLGLAEHGRGHQMMIDRRRLVLERRAHKGHGLVDGDRRQLQPVGDIADGVDVRHIGAREFVDDHFALPADFDAGLLQAEPIGVGHTADGQHQAIGFQNLAVIGKREDFAVPLVDPPEDAVGDDAHALLVHGLGQRVAHVLVEAAQDLVAAIDQRHLAAQAMEDVGELDRDIAAAGDDDPARQLVEMKRLVGGDGEVGAEAIAHVAAGPAAGGDKDGARGDGAIRLSSDGSCADPRTRPAP